MPANTNFQIKVTLQDANTIKRALEFMLSEQLKRITEAGGPNRLPGAAADVGRIETLLRRDFGYEGSQTSVQV